MEEPLKSQSTTNDDEVLLKQKDGSFKLVKMSELLSKEQRAKSKEQVSVMASEPRGETKPFIPSIQLLDQTAEELLKKSGLAVAPELRQRFKIIIISRLKDVRKIPETRERLLANPSSGGVGLKPEEAERVMKMV